MDTLEVRNEIDRLIKALEDNPSRSDRELQNARDRLSEAQQWLLKHDDRVDSDDDEDDSL